MYKEYLKRIIDMCCAIVLLVLVSPILVIVGLLLTMVNKGNPFFFQLRPGLQGAIFKIVKFKTMTDERDSKGSLLPDAERMTKVGSFVRKTSLDEIPQLLNVLKGDMSLIGPRPLLPEYLPLYNKEQQKRHDVRPGITGWAQVHGRNAISWEQKFEYDVWYVQNLSFVTDVKIVLKTLKKVVISEGVNAAGQATTEAFKGSVELNSKL